ALVGFPPGFAAEFRKNVDESMHYEAGKDPSTAGAQRRDVDAMSELDSGVFALLPELITRRRHNPQEDLISALVHAELDDVEGESRSLTDDEIVGFVQLVATAGSETVVRLLGFAGVELARHPDQRELLVGDPSLIPNAVEETLRYEAPSPIQARWVAR